MDFVSVWKAFSIVLTGAFGVLGLLTEFKDKATNKITRWGRIALRFHVNPTDVGKMIGRQGRTGRAFRTICRRDCNGRWQVFQAGYCRIGQVPSLNVCFIAFRPRPCYRFDFRHYLFWRAPMKRLIAVGLLLCFSFAPTFAASGPHSGSRSYSHSSSRSSFNHSYPRSSSSRPYYGGGRHTASHGGSYGVSGSSHRGEHYTSRTGSHHYGRHK
jgi:predicted RNA-binding protein YlqC (UPF0109 family)